MEMLSTPGAVGTFTRPGSITSRDVHVDVPLTNILVGYHNLAYIADDVFPIVGVNKQSDIIPKYDQSPWFRRQAALRGPGTRSKRGTFTNDITDTYYCPRYSFGVELDDETRDNADSIWDLEVRSIQLASDVVQMEREMQLATKIFTTGKWFDDEEGGTDFTVFSNYQTSTPMSVLADYQDEIETRIGMEGNSILFGKQVWNRLRWHPDLIDTIKYVERGLITEQVFSELVGFDRIQIGRALYTADPEGTAESAVTYSRIWGPHILIYYRAPSPSLMDPSAGYTFTWQRVPNSLQYALRHRDDEAEKTIYEANTYFAQKIVVPRAGTFLHNAVS